MLLTRLPIFSTTLFTNNYIQVVIRMHSFQFDRINLHTHVLIVNNNLQRVQKKFIKRYRGYVCIEYMLMTSFFTIILTIRFLGHSEKKLWGLKNPRKGLSSKLIHIFLVNVWKNKINFLDFFFSLETYCQEHIKL